LHIAQISFFLDPQRRTPAQILTDWWALVDVAEMVERCGARVSVVQACADSRQLTQNGVHYHFVAPERGQSTITTGSGFARLIRELEADVFHVHGLSFPEDVLALAATAPGTPILLQDHADRVPRWWRRRARRRGMSAAAGMSFCALEQAQPFVRAGLIREQTELFEISEASSRFSPGDRQAARLETGLYGDPAILWVGHLDANKDPLTMLSGVSAAAERSPGLELWCCFGQAPLLQEVHRRIADDARLSGRVHLLGKVPHARIERLMRAADLFALGSHREGSGFSAIEALACGLPPVVTDIPSFRMLTAGGKVGALWPCGDDNELCQALLRTAARPRQELRDAVRAHFEREISFDAIGRKLTAAYDKLITGAALPEKEFRRGGWIARRTTSRSR